MSETLDSLRLFGVEDGSFEAFPRKKGSLCFLCGVEMESSRIVSVKLERIQVDGLDATEKLVGMLVGFQGDAIILGGITFAGFNVVDPWEVYRETGCPVIVYSGVRPDNEKMYRALRKHFPDWQKRWKIIQSLGPIIATETFPGEPTIYFEAIGCTEGYAENVLRSATLISRIPEPVRVAGIIARGLSPAC